jgi:hypothetical protein
LALNDPLGGAIKSTSIHDSSFEVDDIACVRILSPGMEGCSFGEEMLVGLAATIIEPTTADAEVEGGLGAIRGATTDLEVVKR